VRALAGSQIGDPTGPNSWLTSSGPSAHGSSGRAGQRLDLLDRDHESPAVPGGRKTTVVDHPVNMDDVDTQALGGFEGRDRPRFCSAMTTRLR